MAEPSNVERADSELRPPPELPDRLTNPWPPVLIGTAIWLVVFVVLLIVRLRSGESPDVWLWTAMTGVILGGIGLSIMTWQRSAARRGSRTAQDGL